MENKEFDIEKVESLDFNTISKQLKYIFKTEQDIVNFVNFLKNIQNFVSLSDNKKHETLLDLGYFKSQIQLFEKRIKSLINKRQLIQTKASIKRAKGAGEKITENVVSYYSEEDQAIEGLEELYNLVSSWVQYLTDVYYITNRNNKVNF